MYFWLMLSMCLTLLSHVSSGIMSRWCECVEDTILLSMAGRKQKKGHTEREKVRQSPQRHVPSDFLPPARAAWYLLPSPILGFLQSSIG